MVMNQRAGTTFLRDYSKALEDSKKLDVSSIKGNLADDLKRLCLATFQFFVSTPDKSYGADIGNRLRLSEINIREKEGASSAETVFEVFVDNDMCNVFGVMHGGCAAYIVDPCSISSLVALGLHMGFDGRGVSQAMYLIWHQPIRRGSTVRVVSNSIATNGRVGTSRTEIWDADTLCVYATHSTVNPSHKIQGISKL